MSSSSVSYLYIPGAQTVKHLGKVYVVTSNDKDFQSTKALYLQTKDKYELLSLQIIQVNNLSELEDEALATEAFKKNATFIACFLNLDAFREEARFMVMRRSDSITPLSLDFMEFVIEVDKEQRQIIGGLFDDLFNIGGGENFPWALKLFLDSLIGIPFRGVFYESAGYGMVPTVPFKKRSVASNAAYSKAKQDFVQNVTLWKNQEAIGLVIEKLPASIKNKIIEEHLRSLSDNEVRNFYEKYVNLESAAQESKVRFIVRRKKADEEISGTDGWYRICYSYDNGPDVAFHFPYRADAAFYLCCLMKRKGPQGDSDIDHTTMKDSFIGAFKYLYGDDDTMAENAFYELLDKQGSTKQEAQGHLKDRINNIRKVIDHHLLRKDNTALFYIKKNSHIHMLGEKIILPKNIYSEVERLAKKGERIIRF